MCCVVLCCVVTNSQRIIDRTHKVLVTNSHERLLKSKSPGWTHPTTPPTINHSRSLKREITKLPSNFQLIYTNLPFAASVPSGQTLSHNSQLSSSTTSFCSCKGTKFEDFRQARIDFSNLLFRHVRDSLFSSSKLDFEPPTLPESDFHFSPRNYFQILDIIPVIVGIIARIEPAS
ncbi:hypothetical protein CMV_023832 [Castanea mollissima]|uniref:Uncharacterized protein n=1 Tax=Castanea mollissima TaxID=60419 RepID=A0A8J4V6G0_9ROSI|nr:hypothetical protein CMV_023832 [Castanea mollissima]